MSKPRFSVEFPAEYIETKMDWDDLVLNPNTLQQIQEIENWIKYNNTLPDDWGRERSSNRDTALCSTALRAPERR